MAVASEARFAIAVIVAVMIGWLAGTYMAGRQRQCVTYTDPQIGLTVYCYRGAPVGAGT